MAVWLVSAARATLTALPDLDARVGTDADRHGEGDRDPPHERDRGHVAGEVRRMVARERHEHQAAADAADDRPDGDRE